MRENPWERLFREPPNLAHHRPVRVWRRTHAVAVLDFPPRGQQKTLASGPAWRHGVSLFGDLKYQPGFKHFEYVNPQAPKGGVARQIAVGTYDNFNIAVAGVKGALATGIDFIYDTLLVSALDEVSSEYGLLAETVRYPDDFSSVTYRLRAEAKWHDGKPVTPEDVIFSLQAFKKYSPQLAAYYRHVVKAEKAGERDVVFTFDLPGNRELPQIVGQILGFAQALVGGHRRQRQQARYRRHDARSAAGLGPLPDQRFFAGAQHRLSARDRLLG